MLHVKCNVNMTMVTNGEDVCGSNLFKDTVLASDIYKSLP